LKELVFCRQPGRGALPQLMADRREVLDQEAPGDAVDHQVVDGEKQPSGPAGAQSK